MFQGINQLLKQLGGPWKESAIEHDLASHRTHAAYIPGISMKFGLLRSKLLVMVWLCIDMHTLSWYFTLFIREYRLSLGKLMLTLKVAVTLLLQNMKNTAYETYSNRTCLVIYR